MMIMYKENWRDDNNEGLIEGDENEQELSAR